MKKIFSAFLLMTMMVASVGSFVSCSDIEDAIAKVENTANDNAAQIKDLEGKVAALQTALATAQADAAAAKAAADKAAQAAATAKAEAIEAALAEIAKVQGDVDAVEAAIAAVEAKLALKADVATVEQIQKTLEIYAGLGIEDKAEAEAVAALLAKIEAGEFATAESVADLVAQVKAINTKLAAVTNIVAALANQIQSVVYVPETLAGTAQANGYVLPAATAKDTKYTDLLVKMTYEVSPKALATAVTAENAVFATVPVKAAAAEYFAVEVVDASEETGRVVVYAHIPVNAKSAAYNALTDGKNDTNVALALTIADAKEIAVVMGDEEKTLDAGSYVQSAYVGVTSEDNPWDNIYDNFVIYNKTAKAAIKGTELTKVEHKVAYDKAPGLTSVFGNFEVLVKVEGEYVTVAEAAAFTGFEFKLANDFKASYVTNGKFDATKEKENPFTVTGKDLATTVQFAGNDKVKDDQLVNCAAVVAVGSFTVNGQAIPGTIEATYTIVEKNSDFEFSTVNVDWKHTYGTSVVVPAQELAVNGTDFDITKTDINKTNFVAEYKSADGKTTYKANAKVEAMSSKAVKLVSIDALPFAKGAETTYTFNGDVVYNNVKYAVSFDVVLGAMPEDKTIDLGTFNIDAATTAAMTIEGITPVSQAQAWIKASDATVPAIESFVTDLKAGKKVVTLDGKESTAISAVINPTVNAKKAEVSTIVVNGLAKYENTITVTEVYSIYGVNFTYTATIVTKKPTISFKPAAAYVTADNKVNLDGTVKFEYAANGSTKNSTDFELNAIDLEDYVDVTIPKALAGEFKVRYTLKNNPFQEYDKDNKLVYSVIPGTKDTKFDASYMPSVTATKLDPGAECELKWNAKNEFRELTYEIALVSVTTVTDPKTKVESDIVFDSFEVTLVVPEVIKSFTADKQVKVKYQNGTNVASANIVGALAVVDKLGNAIYNPYATTCEEIWSGYELDKDGKFVKNTTEFFNAYAQNLVLPKKNAGVKAYINGTDVTAQVKPNVDEVTGKVTINPETATVTGNVVVEVPVSLEYIYDVFGTQAKTATVQVVFEVE